MSIEELSNELKKVDLNDKELENFKDGANMVDNALKLTNNESTRVGIALLTYMILKAKENGRF
ncbi:MAG: hypothetical protein RR325_04225 [Bacilli bacterium]